MTAAFKGKTKIRHTAETETAVIVAPTKRKNNTTGRSPFQARLTEQEWVIMQNLNNELQQLTNKRLSNAKVLRGLLHMSDKINKNKLIESILHNT